MIIIWEKTYMRISLKDLAFVVMIFFFGLSTRLLIAPYTGHWYDINVHRVWLSRLLNNGPFFYVSSEGMGLFGEYWGHDPNFCELPPIYPLTLLLMGKIYVWVQRDFSDAYLLVMFMKVPQIIAECGIAILIYYIVRKEANPHLGVLSSSLFLINPFTFFLTAIWGAPESLVAFFALISIYAAYERRYLLAAFSLGASVMVKPYAVVFLLPIIIFSYPDLKLAKTLFSSLIAALSAGLIALPWLVVQGMVFVDAMLSGGVHNLGIRIWEGTIWGFPSFWQIVKFICDISGFQYSIIAPAEFYIYLLVTLLICFITIKSGLNLERRNLWLTAYLFLFTFMLFFPSAHEKWEYSCFPLLLVAAFLGQRKRKTLLFIYFASAFSLFGTVYGDGHYFFASTDILPMPRSFVHGGALAESWYNILWSATKTITKISFPSFSPILLIIIFLYLIMQPSIWQYYKEPKTPLREGVIITDSFQTRLDDFWTPIQEEPRYSQSIVPSESIINEAAKAVENFQSHLNNIKEVSGRLREAEKMLEHNEIEHASYEIVTSDLEERLLSMIEEMYKMMEMLNLLMAKVKLERAKEAIELNRFTTLEYQNLLERDAYLKRKIYEPLRKWEDVISKIDASLKSLTFEDDLSIVQNCLSILRKRKKSNLKMMPPEEVERWKDFLKQRLDIISKRWTIIKRGKAEQIMRIEPDITQVLSEIREVEVRFSVGEFNRDTFEYKFSILNSSLKKLKEEIKNIQECMNETEERIFRCLELSKEIFTE